MFKKLITLCVLLVLLTANPAYSSTSVTYEGVTYTIPEVGETDWFGATKVDGFLVAVGQNSLQKTGGNFTLSSEIDFGATAGLLGLYWGTTNASPSSAGIFRLSNAESIGWRNAADSANLLLSVNSSDDLTYNGVTLLSDSGLVPVTSGGTGLASYTTGDIVYASSDPSALSKLPVGAVDETLISNGSLPYWGVLPVTGGGTGLASYSAGDLIYANADSSVLSKLNIGSANGVLRSDGSTMSWGTTAIAGGGTGQVTAAAAYDALSGTTTEGDLTVRGASAAARLAIGTSGQILTANTGVSGKIEWAAAPTSDGAALLENVGFKTSVSASALTVTLQQSDGSSDPTAGSPVKIGFRNTTTTTGGYDVVTATSALTATLSSGSTAGFSSAKVRQLYVYAINNAGTIELALSGNGYFQTEFLQSTSAEGGAGAADDFLVAYSGSARSNVPFRLIGIIEFSLTTAGTWDETGDVLSVATVVSERGTVTSHADEGVKTTSAYITNSGTPTVTRETGDWITSITDNNIGDFTINVRDGTFANAPQCVCVVIEGSLTQVFGCNMYSASSSSGVRLRTQSGGLHGSAINPAPVDRNTVLICEATK